MPYPRLASLDVEPRRAARVLVVNEEQQVLLLFHDRVQDAPHWAPPGGGLEDREPPRQAVERELREETGLRNVDITGPHWLWQHHFSYFGQRIEQHEVLYLARITTGSPEVSATTYQAADGIEAFRWWSESDLRDTQEDVWPHGLVEILATLPPPACVPTGLADLGLTTRL